MKKVLVIFGALVLVLITATSVLAAPSVILDGQLLLFDVPPIIENGRTLVPLGAIFEALGANVTWDETTQTVTATKSEIVIKLQINSKTAYKNNKAISLEAAPQIINGRTLIPLGFVSEALGANIGWNAEDQTITIKRQDPITAIVSDNKSAILNNTDIPKTLPPVFKGFFKNTDYSNPNQFLYCGDQTKADSNIKEIAKNFNDAKDITTIREIYGWINENLQSGNGEKFGRTASDIIQTRTFTGCTDMGLAFAALSREKGIPTVFLQTAKTDWIKDLISDDPNQNYIRGHILVEVYLSDNKWYLIDSTAGKLYSNYNKDNLSLNDGYYVFSKSIEVWDTGIKNEKENSANMLNIFKDFELNKYISPQYDYIDLNSDADAISTQSKEQLLLPGNGSVILGDKSPVELFYDKFFAGLNCTLSSENNVSQDSLLTAPYIIELYVMGVKIPIYLVNEYFPEITTYQKVRKSISNGQIRVLIMGESDDEIINIINNLPNDFLKNK